MVDAVVPQADLSSLLLRSLSSFSSVLAIFSADNVAPIAMIQMESLGSTFLTSGKYADQIPDLLQRYNSVHLDRLALSVGWRKNDSASVMALSAGGQAIALLSVVLGSMFTTASLGEILKELSQKLLPNEACLASMSQMVAVAQILEKKAAAVGFGNHLAHQTVQIHKMYDRLGQRAPTDLLEQITSSVMIDLLERISRAVRKPHTILRISGTYGAGYVASVITMVFPHDVLVTLDGIVVFEGTRKPCSIVLELGKPYELPLTAEYEVVLDHRDGLGLPIGHTNQEASTVARYSFLGHLITFKRNGYLADAMTIEFLRFQIEDVQGVLQGCCNVIYSLILNSSRQDGLINSSWNDNDGPSTVKVTKSMRKAMTIYRSLSKSLGSQAQSRICAYCQTLIGVVPSELVDVSSSYRFLFQVFERATQMLICQCKGQRKLQISSKDGFTVPSEINDVENYLSHISCGKCHLWMRVGLTLAYLFWSLFIEVQSEHVVLNLRPACTKSTTTVASDGSYSRPAWIARDYLNFINACLGLVTYTDKGIGPPSEVIHNAIGTLFCGRSGDHSRAIARGTGGQLVIPSTLIHLALRPGLPVTYTVFDGNLILQGNSYKNLICDRDLIGQGVESPDILAGSDIFPSSIGQHNFLQVTVRETLDHLALRTIARVSSVDVEIDLRTAILRSHLLQQAPSCQHDPKSQLSAEFRENAKAVSVDLRSLKSTSIVWISLTKDNPEAQLLCCRVANLLLASDCCLDCAYRQMQQHPEFERGKRQLIIL